MHVIRPYSVQSKDKSSVPLPLFSTHILIQWPPNPPLLPAKPLRPRQPQNNRLPPKLLPLLKRLRKRQHLLPTVIRRSARRLARRLTLRTFTKVCLLVLGRKRVSSRTSPQAGPPRHGYLEQGHGYPEFVCQRYLRAYCRRGI